MVRGAVVQRCFFLLIMSMISTACENDTEEIKKVTSREEFPAETVLSAEMLYSEDAEIQVKILAPIIEKYIGENPYNEMPEGIDVTFYDSAMNVTSRLTSNYAIDRVGDHVMEARNDVVVINEKQEQLNTEHLIWDKKNARIYSDEFVKITTKDEIIMGEGFESNQEFTKYTLKKPRGTLSREDD